MAKKTKHQESASKNEMNAQVIGVISIKGGVGKTTTVSNLGAVLANDYGKKVLLVDANFSAPNLGLHFGIVNPEITIHDVLNDKSDIKSAIVKSDYGFDVIPASLMPKRRINAYKLKNRIDDVRKMYDVIIIDSSPSLNEEMLSTIIASDSLLVVTSPDYPTLSCTLRALKLAKEKKKQITGLILNKVRNKKFELSLNEIEDASDYPVLAVLDDDIKILEALALTKPAALHAPEAKAVVEYRKLAAALVGEYDQGKGLFGSLMNIFGKKDKQDINRLELVTSSTKFDLGTKK